MKWRPAKSLIQYRQQINERYPNRSKASDGLIGDPSHAAEGNASDHNPWVKDKNGIGVVTAFDLTHDPNNGVDIAEQAELLARSGDPRIKYFIANRRIFQNGKWSKYLGTDPHTNHLHLSVNITNYDDSQEWSLGIMDADKYLQAGDVQNYYRAFEGREPSNDEVNYWVGKTFKNLYYTNALGQATSLNNQIKDLKATAKYVPLNKPVYVENK